MGDGMSFILAGRKHFAKMSQDLMRIAGNLLCILITHSESVMAH